MFNVCPGCGTYNVEKIIDSTGPFAICPDCSYAHPFLQQPLVIITGPSGAGKSTVGLELLADLSEYVILDRDILWLEEFRNPKNNYHGREK